MYLITAATQFELSCFTDAYNDTTDEARLCTCVTGMGPVESAAALSLYLAQQKLPFTTVIHLGCAGAYMPPDPQQSGPGILDICLAKREILGDFGICYASHIAPLSFSGQDVPRVYPLDPVLLHQAETLLQVEDIPYYVGDFVTVNACTATNERARHLAVQYQGLCENMEGAAVARVCALWGLSLLEIRCMSNMVEERNRKNWRIQEACVRCGEIAAKIVRGLSYA